MNFDQFQEGIISELTSIEDCDLSDSPIIIKNQIKLARSLAFLITVIGDLRKTIKSI